jgi:hypothetical protein
MKKVILMLVILIGFAAQAQDLTRVGNFIPKANFERNAIAKNYAATGTLPAGYKVQTAGEICDDKGAISLRTVVDPSSKFNLNNGIGVLLKDSEEVILKLVNGEWKLFAIVVCGNKILEFEFKYRRQTKVVVNDCNPIVLAHNAMLNDLNAGLIDYNFALQQYYNAQSSPCGKYLLRPTQPLEVAEEFENITGESFQDNSVVGCSDSEDLKRFNNFSKAYQGRYKILQNGKMKKVKFRDLEDFYSILEQSLPNECFALLVMPNRNGDGKVIAAGLLGAAGGYALGRSHTKVVYRDVAAVETSTDGPIINPNDSGEEDGGIFGGNGSGEQGGRSNSGGKRSTGKTTGW